MKKVSLILIILSLIFACNHSSDTFKIEGKIDGINSDTIFIYEMERDSNYIDTILLTNGAFSYETPINHKTSFLLLFPHHTISYPIFAEKGLKVNIQGDSLSLNFLEIKGGELNDKLNEFRQSLISIESPDSLQKEAASFIKENPYSPVSIQVLEKYFVAIEKPDYEKIQELIKAMSGELQDNMYVKKLLEQAEKLQESVVGKRAPTFSLTNPKDEKISFTQATYRSKYILINFWASWSESSLESNQMIKRIKEKFKKEKDLEFIGISLDINKQTWLDQIKNDTLNWEQLSDLNGWESTIVSQYGIQRIPTNILVSPQRIIIARDLNEEELISKLEETLNDSTRIANKK